MRKNSKKNYGEKNFKKCLKTQKLQKIVENRKFNCPRIKIEKLKNAIIQKVKGLSQKFLQQYFLFIFSHISPPSPDLIPYISLRTRILCFFLIETRKSESVKMS